MTLKTIKLRNKHAPVTRKEVYLYNIIEVTAKAKNKSKTMQLLLPLEQHGG